MIPAAQGEGGQRASDIGKDIKRIKDALVGEKSLDYLGADAEYKRYAEEGKVEDTATRAVDNPIKT